MAEANRVPEGDEDTGSESDGSWADWPLGDPETARKRDEELARRAAHIKQRKANGNWCQCGRCYPVLHVEPAFDITCCQESKSVLEVCVEHKEFGASQSYTCITHHDAFITLCLYERYLVNSIIRPYGMARYEPDLVWHALLREAAYKSFRIWVYGNSGYPIRNTVPQSMLYLIGLGLSDVKDITVKGLEKVKECKRVYLEAYTSILGVGKDELEKYYGREVIIADRDLIEQGADEILADADTEDVALLVVGDPFGATTHTDFILRATEKNIPYSVIHNASIMNAIGCCGLQLYNFGETVSIVFWTDDWKPESFYDKIAANRDRGMHTLCLLDIKVKEQSIENLCRGRKIYEPPRYMTVNQAAEQLLEIVSNRRSRGDPLAFTEDTLCVGVSRVGADDQSILTGTLSSLTDIDLGPPLHSLVIVGKVHPLETDMLKLFAQDKEMVEKFAELA